MGGLRTAVLITLVALQRGQPRPGIARDIHLRSVQCRLGWSRPCCQPSGRDSCSVSCDVDLLAYHMLKNLQGCAPFAQNVAAHTEAHHLLVTGDLLFDGHCKIVVDINFAVLDSDKGCPEHIKLRTHSLRFHKRRPSQVRARSRYHVCCTTLLINARHSFCWMCR
jgi:hypothetical protein